MTSPLRYFVEVFMADLSVARPRVLIVWLCVYCSVAVASLYLVAAVAHSVLPGSPYDLSVSATVAAFVGALILGSLLGGRAIAKAESADENRGRLRLIGMTTFLVTAVLGSLAGALFMVLLPLVLIPSAIVLTIIVISGRPRVPAP